jgi:hypothetical protein
LVLLYTGEFYKLDEKEIKNGLLNIKKIINPLDWIGLQLRCEKYFVLRKSEFNFCLICARNKKKSQSWNMPTVLFSNYKLRENG